MKSKVLAIAACSLMMLGACTSSHKETTDEQAQNNPEMGIIDNGDSLVVDDVELSDSAQIAADTIQ